MEMNELSYHLNSDELELNSDRLSIQLPGNSTLILNWCSFDTVHEKMTPLIATCAEFIIHCDNYFPDDKELGLMGSQTQHD